MPVYEQGAREGKSSNTNLDAEVQCASGEADEGPSQVRCVQLPHLEVGNHAQPQRAAGTDPQGHAVPSLRDAAVGEHGAVLLDVPIAQIHRHHVCNITSAQ